MFDSFKKFFLGFEDEEYEEIKRVKTLLRERPDFVTITIKNDSANLQGRFNLSSRGKQHITQYAKSLAPPIYKNKDDEGVKIIQQGSPSLRSAVDTVKKKIPFMPYRDPVHQSKTSPKIEIDPQEIINTIIFIKNADMDQREAIVGELNNLVKFHFPSLFKVGFSERLIELHAPKETRDGCPDLGDFQSGLEASGVEYYSSIYLKDTLLILGKRELKGYVGIIYRDRNPRLIISNQQDGLVTRSTVYATAASTERTEVPANTTTRACPGCSQTVRVPSDRGTVKIICPKCHVNWLWSPPSSELESSPSLRGVRGKIMGVQDSPASREPSGESTPIKQQPEPPRKNSVRDTILKKKLSIMKMSPYGQKTHPAFRYRKSVKSETSPTDSKHHSRRACLLTVLGFGILWFFVNQTKKGKLGSKIGAKCSGEAEGIKQGR